MEAAIVSNPVSELAAADKALIVAIHVFEKTLTIKMELVALFVEFSVALENETKDGSQLLEPRHLEQFFLFNAQVGRHVGLAAQSLRSESGDPFTDLDDAVIVCVDDIDQAGHV